MSEEDRKERQWRTSRGLREDCPFPELYRQIGLKPADTKLNKRAAAYAKSASWHHYSTARRRRLGLAGEAAEED
jgi:hypothetical protein